MIDKIADPEEGIKAEVGSISKTFKRMAPYVNSKPKIQRNAPCSCGSGKKYKQCCELELRRKMQLRVIDARHKAKNK